MKILHIVPTYLPAVRYGGPIVSVHGLCRALVNAGHEVAVATTNVDGPGVSDVPLGQRVDVDGVGVFYFEASRLMRRLYYSRPMKSWLRCAMNNYDVVHVHASFLWPTHFGISLANALGRPVVYSPRGMLNRDLIRGKSRWIKRLSILLYDRRDVRSADCVHVTASTESRAIDELGLEYQRIEQIGNGIDLNHDRHSTQTADSSAMHDQPYLLYLGRLTPNKNPSLLIRVIADLPDLDVLFVGPDQAGMRPELEKLATHLNVQDRIHFAGQVQDEKWRYYSDALAFCLPSDAENFANTVLEAASMGCPVIVSTGVGLADAVRQHDAGVVTNLDPDEIRLTVSSLVNDASLRQHYGSNALTMARTFEWPVIVDHYTALYQSLLDNSAIQARPPQEGTVL